MGIWDRFRAPVDSEKKGFADLNDILNKYDLVETHDDYIIVAEKSKQFADQSGMGPLFGEIGSSASSPFTSWSRLEYNPELRGLSGLQKYDRMRKSDGTIRGLLRLVKTPVLAGRWFIEPASQDQKDLDIAEFVEDCLWEYPGVSWAQFLTEAMLMCEFGYYMFEKVWEPRIIDGVPRIVLSKLAPRHPMDVQKWAFDKNGGPDTVYFWPFDLYDSNIPVPIPIAKMLVFTFDMEAGNIEGISILRSAYKHWFYKEQLYKIDAIQKERHGIGIPVIQMPMGYSLADKNAANELGRNLRSNERAHVVLPPNWTLTFAKLEGHVVDSLASIEVHNEAILMSVLGNFINPESRATADESHSLFMKSSRFIADIIASTINQYLLPELVAFNFGPDAEVPELKVRRIGEAADWRTLSFAIRNLVGAGALVPDDVLEAQLREEMDLPVADPTTARLMATPQGSAEFMNPETGGPADAVDPSQQTAPVGGQTVQPGRTGMPRQGSPSNKSVSSGKGHKNAGIDSSGGK